MNQSIYDLINNEDPQWVESIMQCEDVPWLNQKLARAKKKDRKAIIQARIDNLNYLVV